VSDAGRAGAAEAETDFKLATLLDPSNRLAYIGLARVQIQAGSSEQALGSLARAGDNGESQRLKVQALLELSRYNEAADTAAILSTPAVVPSADLSLSALAMILAGRTNYADSLIARLPAAGDQQTLQRAQSSRLALAHELYERGLLSSADATLRPQVPSLERNLLLARVGYTRNTPGSLAEAATLLAQAVTFSPASLETRQLLESVYRAQNNFAAASAQTTQISHLKSGRP
jgi:hypothetical protein